MKKEVRKLFLGETFEEKRSILKDRAYYGYNTLYDCYDRCSYEKERIYEKYARLLHDNCDMVERYGVKSYNTFMFTIHAEIIKDGVRYYVLITPSHNYFIEL